MKHSDGLIPMEPINVKVEIQSPVLIVQQQIIQTPPPPLNLH